MKNVYKWNIDKDSNNYIYAFLTNIDNEPFIYRTDGKRFVSDNTWVDYDEFDELAITQKVMYFSEEEYMDNFNKMQVLISEYNPNIAVMDYSFYYDIENEGCSEDTPCLVCYNFVTKDIEDYDGTTYKVILQGDDGYYTNPEFTYTMQNTTGDTPFVGGVINGVQKIVTDENFYIITEDSSMTFGNETKLEGNKCVFDFTQTFGLSVGEDNPQTIDINNNGVSINGKIIDVNTEDGFIVNSTNGNIILNDDNDSIELNNSGITQTSNISITHSVTDGGEISITETNVNTTADNINENANESIINNVENGPSMILSTTGASIGFDTGESSINIQQGTITNKSTNYIVECTDDGEGSFLVDNFNDYYIGESGDTYNLFGEIINNGEQLTIGKNGVDYITITDSGITIKDYILTGDFSLSGTDMSIIATSASTIVGNKIVDIESQNGPIHLSGNGIIGKSDSDIEFKSGDNNSYYSLNVNQNNGVIIYKNGTERFSFSDDGYIQKDGNSNIMFTIDNDGHTSYYDSTGIKHFDVGYYGGNYRIINGDNNEIFALSDTGRIHVHDTFCTKEDIHTALPDESGQYQMNGGSIYTHGGIIRTGGITTGHTGGGSIQTDGGHIFTYGGSIQTDSGSIDTNSGDIFTKGGDIDTDGGDIYGGTVKCTGDIIFNNNVRLHSDSPSLFKITSASGNTFGINANNATIFLNDGKWNDIYNYITLSEANGDMTFNVENSGTTTLSYNFKGGQSGVIHQLSSNGDFRIWKNGYDYGEENVIISPNGVRIEEEAIPTMFLITSSDRLFGTRALQLMSTGDLYISGQLHSNQTSSDIRLKNVLETNPSFDIDKLLDLSIIYYTLKDDETKEKQIGLIAQELVEICPELVHIDKDGYYSLNYSKFSVLLLYLIKDLYKKIK